MKMVVMIVSTGDLPPRPPQIALNRPPPRYYWRGLTYDRYVPSGWYAGATETIAYGAGEPAITTTLATQRTVRQEVQVVGDVGTTGLSTGPHCHYQMWKSGRFVDPMRVDLPRTEPVPDALSAEFEAAVARWVPMLPSVGRSD